MDDPYLCERGICVWCDLKRQDDEMSRVPFWLYFFWGKLVRKVRNLRG